MPGQSEDCAHGRGCPAVSVTVSWPFCRPLASLPGCGSGRPSGCGIVGLAGRSGRPGTWRGSDCERGSAAGWGGRGRAGRSGSGRRGAGPSGCRQRSDGAADPARIPSAPVARGGTGRGVSRRLKRKQILTVNDPPRVWAVIDESALRRPLGGRDSMRAQLRHLMGLAELPHVTIQVMPFSRGGHSAAGGSFSILRFAEPDLPDVVYIEQLTGALYLDKAEELDRYREVMNSLSAEADTPDDSERELRKIIKAM